MDAQQFSEFYRQNFYYLIGIQLVIGAILGAIPLLLSLRRGKAKLGTIGFILCLLISALSPLISLILAIVFAILVTRRSPVQQDADVDAGE